MNPRARIDAILRRAAALTTAPAPVAIRPTPLAGVGVALQGMRTLPQAGSVEYDSDDESAEAVAFRQARRQKQREIAEKRMAEMRKAAAQAGEKLGLNAIDPDEELLALVPATFKCPISKKLIRNPVFLISDGQTYERREIENWLRQHKTSPFTAKPANVRELAPNYTLKSAIDEFRTRILPQLQRAQCLEKENAELKERLRQMQASRVDERVTPAPGFLDVKQAAEPMAESITAETAADAAQPIVRRPIAVAPPPPLVRHPVYAHQLPPASEPVAAEPAAEPIVRRNAFVAPPPPLVRHPVYAHQPPPLPPPPILETEGQVPAYSIEDLQAEFFSAVMEGHVARIQSLMPVVDVNAEVNGMTPLLTAVIHLQLEAVRQLLRNPTVNVNVAYSNPEYNRPEDFTSPEFRIQFQATPLIMATRLHKQHPEVAIAIIRLLTARDRPERNRAVIDRVDCLGRSALHWAAANNDSEAVGLLVRRNARSSLQDRGYFTPLGLAYHVNRLSVAPFIQEMLRPVVPQPFVTQAAAVAQPSVVSAPPRGVGERVRLPLLFPLPHATPVQSGQAIPPSLLAPQPTPRSRVLSSQLGLLAPPRHPQHPVAGTPPSSLARSRVTR